MTGGVMYLIDTNVISDLRKKDKANVGVKAFFKSATEQKQALYISVILYFFFANAELCDCGGDFYIKCKAIHVFSPWE